MRKILKQGLTLMLTALILVTTLTACNGPENMGTNRGSNTDNGDSIPVGVGRFIESELSLPEGTSRILAMTQLEDGTIRMLSDIGVLFDSIDGRNWQEAEVYFDLTEVMPDHMALSAAFGPGGSLFISGTAGSFYIEADGSIHELQIELPESNHNGMIFRSTEDTSRTVTNDRITFDDEVQVGIEDVQGAESDELENSTSSNAIVNDTITFDANDESSGTSQEETTNRSRIIVGGDEEDSAHIHDIDFSQMLSNLTFTTNGYIMATTMMADSIYIINPRTGEIVHQLGSNDMFIRFDSFIEVDGRIIATHTNGVDVYDLNTGQLLELDEALRTFVDSIIGQNSGSIMHFDVGFSEQKLVNSNVDTAFYVLNREGLFRFDTQAGQAEQLINGALTSMSNPGLGFSAFLNLADGRYLISYFGMSGSLLMEYTFDPNAAAAPSIELNVYSLLDDMSLRQAVSLFQSQNPHLLVNLEIGMEDGTATTLNDAIQTLNTRIMAGSGPDVIFLDGLPYESYMANGILLELSDVVASLQQSGRFIDHILEFQRQEGRIYAIPQNFIPLIAAGPSDVLQEGLSLEGLATLVERLRAENPEHTAILGFLTADVLLNTMLHYISHELQQQDGMINEEVLLDYLRNTKRIFDANMREPMLDLTQEVIRSNLDNDTVQSIGILMGVQSPLYGLGAAIRQFDLAAFYSAVDELNWDYQVLDQFIPRSLVGINSMSNRIEESKQLVQSLFQPELQETNMMEGLPVSLDAWDRVYQEAGEVIGGIGVTTEDGHSQMFNIINPSVEQLDSFFAQLEQITSASTIDRIIVEAIVEEGVPMLFGTQSIETTFDQILRRVNLFLAE